MEHQHNIKQTLSQPESISIIRRLLNDQEHTSLNGFTRLICTHFGFLDLQGKAQIATCAKALRELGTKHDFTLPLARRSPRIRTIRRSDQAVAEPSNVPSAAKDVRGLDLVLVETAEQGLIWNEMMMREHPRQAKLMAGHQLRYLIASEHGWLGGFGFSASALTLQDRDQWIGWDHATRKQHQFRAVNMSRFLIRPSVRCQNLASKCMGMVLRRIGGDFERRYGFHPWLLESFIDTALHRGTCYKATNWIRVGQTKGRGRNDTKTERTETIKAIYVFPLQKNFRSLMGVAELSPPVSLAVADGLKGGGWAEQEFGGAQLGDSRLSRRLVQVAEIQAANPMRAFSGAAKGNQAMVKAYYRMIEQPDDSAVTMEAIMAPHRERTIQRMRSESVVLCVQDGSDLNFNALASCEGLGVIGKNQTKASSNGLHLHSTLALNSDGLPLGILRADCHAPVAKGEAVSGEKKSDNWIHSHQDCQELSKQLPTTRIIEVLDREADFYELFEQPRGKRVDRLVRAKHNRITEDGGKMFDAMRKTEAQGRISITVPRQSARPKRSKQKARAKREERVATVEVRYRPFMIKAPNTEEHKGKPSIQLHLVHLKEVSPPSGEKGIEWFLLATWSITNMAQAEECIRWYRLRWRIEDFHRVLKSGCKTDELAYKTAVRLKRGIAINIIIAWRIMLMTLLGREYPELPADILFSELEIKILETLAIKKKRADCILVRQYA